MAHVGPGPAGPPPLGPDGFDWTVWHPDLTVVTGIVALGGLYVAALRRGRAQGLRAKPANVVSFFSGLLVLLGSLTGPLLIATGIILAIMALFGAYLLLARG